MRAWFQRWLFGLFCLSHTVAWAQVPTIPPTAPTVRSSPQAPSTRPAERKAAPAHCDGLERVTVYVPYRKFKRMLRSDGVFLDRKQFNALMAVARRERKRREERVPVQAALLSAKYRGKADRKSVTLQATLRIGVMAANTWTLFPLEFAGLPILRARLDGKPALLIQRQQSGGAKYLLLLRGQGTHTLKITFTGQVTHKAGHNSFRLQIPPTPIASLDVALQGRQLKATLNGHKVEAKEQVGRGTVVTHALGPVERIALRWTVRQQQVKAKKSLITAKINVTHVISQGAIRSHFVMRLKILQAKIRQLKLRISSAGKLMPIEGDANLKTWRERMTPTPKVDHLELTYHRAFGGNYTLRFTIEQLQKPWKKGEQKREHLVLPFVGVRGAQWQEGVIGVRVSPQFQVRLSRPKGISQIDPSVYTKRTRQPQPDLAYYYTAKQYDMGLTMERIKPKLQADLTHQIDLDEKQAQLVTRARFQIKGAGVFQFRFALPKGWEWKEAQHIRTHGNRENLIQDQYVEKAKTKDGTRTLVVVLKRKVGGPQATQQQLSQLLYPALTQVLGWRYINRLSSSQRRKLRQRLQRPQAARILQRVFGTRSQQHTGPFVLQLRMRRAHDIKTAMALPLIRALDTKTTDEKGLVMIRVPDHLRLRTNKGKGLFAKERLSSLSPLERSADKELRQAFTYNQRPASGTLRLSSKKTSLESMLWLRYKLRADGYKLQAQLHYQVRFAGTQTLRFHVPKALSKRLQLQTVVRETSKKEDKAGVLYTVTLAQKAARGSRTTLRFVADVARKKPLQIGQQEKLTLPVITTPGTIKQETYIGLQKQESLSMQAAQIPGIERIDRSDLPSDFDKSGSDQVYRSFATKPAALALSIKRHQYEGVLSSVIEHTHLDVVATQEGKYRVLATMRLKSQGRQFLKVRLPKGSKVMALKVHHEQRYRFELDRGGELLIDLAKAPKGQRFHIALYYEQPLARTAATKRFEGWSGKLSYQGPKAVEVPVMRTTVDLYLPASFTYTSFETAMQRKNRRRGVWSMMRRFLWGVHAVNQWSLFRAPTEMRNYAGALSRKVLPRGGQASRFMALSDESAVTVSFRHQRWQGLIELCVGLLFGLLLLFWGRGTTRHVKRPLLFMLTGIGMLALGVLLPEAWLPFANVGLLSTGVVGFGWGVIALQHAVQPLQQDLPQKTQAPEDLSPAQPQDDDASSETITTKED